MQAPPPPPRPPGCRAAAVLLCAAAAAATAPTPPTAEPAPAPSSAPTAAPSAAPASPSHAPSAVPTAPSESPSAAPTAPSAPPTAEPTAPTHAPSAAPTAPSASPARHAPGGHAAGPTHPPADPSAAPSSSPSVEPLPVPTSMEANARLADAVGHRVLGASIAALGYPHGSGGVAGCAPVSTAARHSAPLSTGGHAASSGGGAGAGHDAGHSAGSGFQKGDLLCVLIVNGAPNGTLPAGFEHDMSRSAAWALQVKPEQIVAVNMTHSEKAAPGYTKAGALSVRPPLLFYQFNVVSTTVWEPPQPLAPGEGNVNLCSCPDYHTFWHGKDESEHGPLYCVLTGETCELHVVCEDHSESHQSHHIEPPYEILFMFVSFVIGALVRYTFQNPPLNKLPYTIVLFVFGLVIGFIAKARGGDSMKLVGISNIDPHLIFHVFLPILIFESAFSLDWHVFKRVLAHDIVLAGPGILVATGITAVLVKAFFTSGGVGTYDWSWSACFLYGCTISATDPVAVVALLKELGAPAVISSMIEGESLFNDGTAIVLFNLLQESVATGHFSKGAGDILWNMIYVACGGPLLGFLVALLAEFCLARVFNDALLEITITLCAAYLTFFTAEGFLHVSGVLALVVLGVWLSHHRQCISPEVEHSLHSFWETTVYLANTLIFVLVGLVAALRGFVYITPTDFGYLLIGYCIITLVRGLVILLFYKPLQYFQWQLEWKPALLVWWGGLRGAVGLALALIVAADEGILCQNRKLGNQFLFHVVGIVSLTLIVNGISTQFLVARLHLSDIPEAKKRVLAKCFDHLVESQKDAIRELKTSHVLSDANWSIVRRYTHEGVRNPYRPAAVHGMLHTSAAKRELPRPEEEAQAAYLKIIKTSVWEQYEHGTIHPETILRLLKFIDVAGSIPGCLLTSDLLNKYWDESVTASRVGGLALSLPKCIGKRLGRLAARWKEERWAAGFDVATALVTAHEDVLAKIDNLIEDIKVANVIKDHCKRVRIQCFAQVNDLANERIEIAVSIQTRHAARGVLNSARAKIQQMIRAGMLAPEDAAGLVKIVEKRMGQLGKAKTQMPMMCPEEVLQEEVPWTMTVESRCSAELKVGGRVYNLRKNERLYDRDNAMDGIWVLVSGVARVRLPMWPPEEDARYRPVRSPVGQQLLCGSGDTVGLGNVLCSEPRMCDAYAETDMRAIWYTADIILGLTQRNPRLERELWHEVGYETAMVVLHGVKPYCDWPLLQLRKFSRDGRVMLPDASSRRMNLQGGMYHVLVHGRVHLHVQSGAPSQPAAGPVLCTPQLINPDGDCVHVTIAPGASLISITDPSSNQAKARRNWGRIRHKIEAIKRMAALLGPDRARAAIHQQFGEGLVPGAEVASEGSPQASPKAVTALRRGRLAWAADSEEGSPLPPTGAAPSGGLRAPLLENGWAWREMDAVK
eukprot:TRINITY_DN16917_c0_g3_i1.p1 TRINITY_DN16917_c0_g3~~TRINITY_DN16917_c0_g3_i1.p1  ORF type:complete len:1453 (+),score=473.18 TRINITY_DN16917_c0_g3_i1:72-4361(+)